jgi:hypothetical protein
MVLVDATGAELTTEAVVVGVDIELTSLCSVSLSLRRLTPRDELSFKPSAVALIRIWCLHTQPISIHMRRKNTN